MNARRWEYLMKDLHITEGEDDLDEAGRYGWELVRVTIVGEKFVCFFKRPLDHVQEGQ